MSWPPETLDEALVTAIAAWNLFGLPALLIAVVAGTLVAAKRAKVRSAPRPNWSNRQRVVRQIGWIHIGLALWGLTTIIDELWTYRTMGIFQSNPVTGLFGSLLGIQLDVPIGLGLLGLRRWARWAAVVLAAIRVWIAWLVLSWIWKFGAAVDLTEWPRVAVSRALPVFLLVVLLLPGTARAVKHTDSPAGRLDGIVAPATRLFIVVLGSVVVTEAADFVVRRVAEMLGSAGP